MKLELPDVVIDAIQELLKIKVNISEAGNGKRIEVLHQYIHTELTDYKQVINGLEDDRKTDWEKLNMLFLKAIGY